LVYNPPDQSLIWKNIHQSSSGYHFLDAAETRKCTLYPDPNFLPDTSVYLPQPNITHPAIIEQPLCMNSLGYMKVQDPYQLLLYGTDAQSQYQRTELLSSLPGDMPARTVQLVLPTQSSTPNEPTLIGLDPSSSHYVMKADMPVRRLNLQPDYTSYVQTLVPHAAPTQQATFTLPLLPSAGQTAVSTLSSTGAMGTTATYLPVYDSDTSTMFTRITCASLSNATTPFQTIELPTKFPPASRYMAGTPDSSDPSLLHLTVDDDSPLPQEIRFEGDDPARNERWRFIAIDGFLTLQKWNGTDWVSDSLRCSGLISSTTTPNSIASNGTVFTWIFDPVTKTLGAVMVVNGVTSHADLICDELPANAIVTPQAIQEFRDPTGLALYRTVAIDDPLSARGVYIQYQDPTDMKWKQAGFDVSWTAINYPVQDAPWSRDWKVQNYRFRMIGTLQQAIQCQYYDVASDRWEPIILYEF